MNSISFLTILIINGCIMMNKTETSGTVRKPVIQTTESSTQQPVITDNLKNILINYTNKGPGWDLLRFIFRPARTIIGMNNRTMNEWRE
ncbi:hypothetical protein MS3_00000731 [Schistosoma haematobium]|uniref:Uncharacterized protein n=1 Tax=Schistosoma haematobium TaxID=6185 RepID=A0A922LEK3_SCHHA|nr:hypothetical protein MS3_00000731 [Schistosoma haematobium]KAH9580799.1 hypothetical protein MS3_00000731 [Schistosoma haematobium]